MWARAVRVRFDAIERGVRAFSAASTPHARGALSGIKVLDLSRILAGPYCTQLLGDLGAEIWKIENPIGGDDTRFWGPPFVKPKTVPVIDGPKSTANAYVHVGESAYFLGVNRNKKSIAINMKEKKGAELIQQLAMKADVLVENFMPGKLAEYGLDYATLSRLNPHLIYASLTGYGSSGPMAETPGYDVMASARGGLMHITGPLSSPSKVGVAITDVSSGLYLHGAILAALFARERDPQRKGQLIETNLLEVQVACLANIGQNFHVDHRMKGRRIQDSSHESIVPYQAFQSKPEGGAHPASATSANTPPSPSSSSSSSSSPPAAGLSSADNYFICGALNNKQYKALCGVVEKLAKQLHPTLDVAWLYEKRFAQNADRVRNRGELIPLLQSVFIQFPKKVLLDEMFHAQLPSSPINNIEQVFEEPQVVHSQIVKTLQHPLVGELKVTGNPIHYSETPTHISRPPPLLGQHTQEILQQQLQIKTDEVKQLQDKDVIGCYHKVQ